MKRLCVLFFTLLNKTDNPLMGRLEPLTYNIHAINSTIIELKCITNPSIYSTIFFLNVKERAGFSRHSVLKLHLQVTTLIANRSLCNIKATK